MSAWADPSTTTLGIPSSCSYGTKRTPAPYARSTGSTSNHLPNPSNYARGVSLATLPPTRQTLLRELKRAGEARAETLAEQLGITVSGVRQQLAALQGDGLVDLARAARRDPAARSTSGR